ncbi:MAG: hypothetical protein SVM79_09135, partial [Chloroflexota bacterium]|nr:hypothetical protein [Chloroflexota bacterium]
MKKIAVSCLLVASMCIAIACTSTPSTLGPSEDTGLLEDNRSENNDGPLPKAFAGRIGGSTGKGNEIELECNVEVPAFPEKVRVYRVIEPEDRKAFAAGLADILGFSGEPNLAKSIPEDADGSWLSCSYVNGDSKLEIWLNGGFDAQYGKVNLADDPHCPSAQDCIQIAEEWLKSYDLYPINGTRVEKGA